MLADWLAEVQGCHFVLFCPSGHALKSVGLRLQGGGFVPET
jgi:hypothetical protein